MATLNKSNEDLKINKLFDVSKFTAIVTGGGTGIGLMITQALATNGAKVYITGRREDALESVVDQYNTGPGQIIAGLAGIARDDNTRFSKAGKFDPKSPDNISEHLMGSESEQWAETFQTNITAQYFMSAAFLPLLAKGREVTPGYSTSIVNVASISGVMKGSSMGQFAYATSKAGKCSRAKSLDVRKLLLTGRRTHPPHPDAVNDVRREQNSSGQQLANGIFPSEMTAGSSGSDQKSELKPSSSNPAGRPGSDSDMAANILFLAGPGGLFMNGQVLYPDGGNILVQPAST
ncbi:MAG: hypothetical protein Q9183_001610 [Haloplaca sp. 2 TL-2023]